MIVKRIGNPKKASTKASRVGSLLDYIESHGSELDQKVEYRFASGDFYADSRQGQRAEMVALCTEARRSKDPVDHWLLSWKAGEQPTLDQCREASDLLKKHLGMTSGHQAICALHRNTENYHLHIVFNRVDPHTFQVADNGWCIDRAHQALAEIVRVQGWEHEGNARFLDGVTVQASKSRPQPKTRARDYENSTGEKSAQRIAIEQAAPILHNASSWSSLHEELSRTGMRYEQKGSGALVWIGNIPVKASVIGREFSRKRMEDRLGLFEAAKAPFKAAEVEREVHPAQSTMPSQWEAYRKAIASQFQHKSVAQAEQRVAHRNAREQQLAAFRQERAELYKGGKWSGANLNVARSLLAGDHARRRVELIERLKKERKALQRTYGQRPTFEQFLAECGEYKTAAAWRYRNGHGLVAAIRGEGDERPTPRDIRDFVAQVRGEMEGRSISVCYFANDNRSQVSFADHGKRIDVWLSSDHAAVLAALQLGSQKWGTLTITGTDEFKHLCAVLAAQHGFKISNPELQKSLPAARKDPDPSKVASTATRASKEPYHLHREDILQRVDVRNPSHLDWMIAIRMRVTGHDERSVTDAIERNAGRDRAAENRDWKNYADRTAKAAFGPRGEREAGKNVGRREAWTLLEGRSLSHKRLERTRGRQKSQRSYDFEIAD